MKPESHKHDNAIKKLNNRIANGVDGVSDKENTVHKNQPDLFD